MAAVPVNCGACGDGRIKVVKDFKDVKDFRVVNDFRSPPGWRLSQSWAAIASA